MNDASPCVPDYCGQVMNDMYCGQAMNDVSNSRSQARSPGAWCWWWCVVVFRHGRDFDNMGCFYNASNKAHNQRGAQYLHAPTQNTLRSRRARSQAILPQRAPPRETPAGPFYLPPCDHSEGGCAAPPRARPSLAPPHPPLATGQRAGPRRGPVPTRSGRSALRQSSPYDRAASAPAPPPWPPRCRP